MENNLKIGDVVFWKGAFGTAAKKKAKIVNIEHTKGGKYGDSVDSICWSLVRDREVCVDLDNGSWAYGSQISRI